VSALRERSSARRGWTVEVDLDGAPWRTLPTDVVVRAAAAIVRRRPDLRSRLVVPIIGGPSGSGVETPQSLRALAGQLGVADVVRVLPPVGQTELVEHYRAASVVCVPSYNESFGLVALEAQACGTPVVAANVGGLPTAVRDGATGILVDGHRPDDYADALERLLDDPRLLASFGRAAAEHATSFGWSRTAERPLDAYLEAQALTSLAEEQPYAECR